MKVINLADARDQRAEGRALEIAGLHRTVDILREYIELAMRYDGAAQRLALVSALNVANRAVPR